MTTVEHTPRWKLQTAKMNTLNAKARLLRSETKLIVLETQAITLKSSIKQNSSADSIANLNSLNNRIIKTKKTVTANTKAFKLMKVKEREAKEVFDNRNK